jgi:hypothetical protein
MTNSDWKDPQPAFTGLSLVKELPSVKDCSTGEKKKVMCMRQLKDIFQIAILDITG